MLSNTQDSKAMMIESYSTVKADGENMQKESSADVMPVSEHERIVSELKNTIAELHTSLNLQAIDKKTLDNKLLESDLFQKLVIQVQAILAYCAYLKQRTEKAEQNILDIEKSRAFELNDLQIKENE